MKYLSAYMILFISVLCVYSYADGDPEFVELPLSYQQNYSKYVTTNRVGREQVATMYANDVAISSYKEGNTANPGSIIIMEIYKVLRDDKDAALKNDDGSFKKGSLAAIAVMERQDSWPQEFQPDHRLEGWGFAIYNPDGTEKENELPCVACHTPLKTNDFLFSFDDLKKYADPSIEK